MALRRTKRPYGAAGALSDYWSMTQTTLPPRTDDDRRIDRLEYEIHHEADVQSSWTIFAVGIAVVALLAALIAGWAATSDDVGGKRTPASAASTKALPKTASVKLTEFALTPKTVSIAEGGTLDVTNAGAIEHNVAVKGHDLASPMLKAGEKGALALTGLAAGTYTMFCAVPGHEAAGMTGTLKVGAATTDHAPAASKGKNATIDWNAMPKANWHAFDPTLQPAQGATVHNVEFHATEKVVEVAPGVKQQMWTFNDQVPGPTLRGHVGDVFNVTLTNDGKMGHSIDFHASKVAPNVAMRTLNPGESLVYQFKADYAGIFMYHCGTAPALHHIGNGMFGAVIVDPPGLPAVDHEYAIVQSELYLGPQGQPGDLTKMQSVAPDAVVFNGYANQYKFSPITVNPGARVRVWVLDAGPSENSSFHIVGTIFDTVYKEGNYVLKPGTGRGGAQALDLQPAQGGFVEFTLDDEGTYPMVTHKFANVMKGALGLFQVGEPAGTMSH
jgi:nitrite reductase (NO-forming)